MLRYRQDLLSQSTGLPLLGVSVTVYLTGTTTKPTLYQTNNTGGATFANPASWDRVFEAYIPDGRYDIIAGGVTLTDVSIYDDGLLFQTVAPLPSIWPLLTSTDNAVQTTAQMLALAAPTAGQRVVVNNDAGTWTGYNDGYVFPAKGLYIRTSAPAYWHWYRPLEKAAHDERINAVFTQAENHARSNLGLTSEVIGKEVTITLNGLGAGQPVWGVRWSVNNVDGSDLWQVRQSTDGGATYPKMLELGNGPTGGAELRLFPVSQRALRLRAVAAGYSFYSGVDTVSGSEAQISTITWQNTAHMGPADNASVLEQQYLCGIGGRLNTEIMGAWTVIARRQEREIPQDAPVQKVQYSCYKKASDSGVTVQWGNSGQGSNEGQYAGRDVNNPIVEVANFQGANGVWAQAWGSDTTRFAWVKSDGLAHFTSLELPEGTPANPAADTLRIYAKDVGGVTTLAYRDSAGNETVL